MSRWARRAWLALTPALLLSVVLLGCSGGDKDAKDGKKDGGKPKADSSKKDDKKDGGGPAGGLQAIPSGTGTVVGKVTLEGDMPDIAALTKELRDAIEKNKDKVHCLMGKESETTQQTWVIDKDKNVGNVFVWLRPVDEDAQFFDVKDLVVKKQGFDPVKELNQPHCAFMPHAQVLFLHHFDKAPKERDYSKAVPTGQTFTVKSTAPMPHNTKWVVDQDTGGSGGSVPVPKDGLDLTSKIKPSYAKPVAISCDIHPWMSAWAWAFDHPYAAVTNAKGEYKIANVPTGVKVAIVAWHEQGKFLKGGSKGQEVTFEEGENKRDFTVTKK